MRRGLCCGAALALFACASWAGQPPAPPETIIRVTVQPMAAPRPALRYTLLPELKDMNPGNPIPNYLKILLDADGSGQQENFGPVALRLADWAARLDTPDWQILPKLKTDGVSLLIPDVQKMRALATGLQERFRVEAAQGRFDDGVRTAQTMFALSQHMSLHPTLVGDLVGIAIANVAIEPLEQMLQQPGCPNLYWALTNLPRPLVPLDKGLEGERLLVQSEFHELSDKAPMTPEQIMKLVRHIELLLGLDGKSPKSARAWLSARRKNKALVSATRTRLVESGLPEERVARFPADQVLLLDEVHKYEARRDELMKLMKFPAWQVDALAARIRPPKEPGLFDFLLPYLPKIRHAQGRLEQRLALLRHVEALRLYAAAHQGKLPSKLTDVEVPLPSDPFTGKPFRYRLSGDTAHLYGSPPRGEEKSAIYNVHYEVTLRK